MFSLIPLIRHFNPDLKIKLETDASDFGLLGILS